MVIKRVETILILDFLISDPDLFWWYFNTQDINGLV